MNYYKHTTQTPYLFKMLKYETGEKQLCWIWISAIQTNNLSFIQIQLTVLELHSFKDK